MHGAIFGLTQGELLKKLWHNYQNFYIHLDLDEQNLVSKAQEISAKNMNKKLKKTLLRLSENFLKSKKKVDDNIIVDKDIRNSSKAADIRIAEVVNEMILVNDSETEWYNRKFLSQKAIFDYALNRKFRDPNNLSLSISVINRFLDNNKDMLSEHHAKYGLDERHNRKAHYERMRIANE